MHPRTCKGIVQVHSPLIPSSPCPCRRYRAERQVSIASLRSARWGTHEKTSPSGSNETSLLSGRGVPRHGRGMTNVLMITTTVGMVDGVHGHTTSSRPRVSLGSHGVVLASSLEEGFVDTSSSSNDSDDSSATRADDLCRGR